MSTPMCFVVESPVDPEPGTASVGNGFLSVRLAVLNVTEQLADSTYRNSMPVHSLDKQGRTITNGLCFPVEKS